MEWGGGWGGGAPQQQNINSESNEARMALTGDHAVTTIPGFHKQQPATELPTESLSADSAVAIAME